VEYDVEKGTVSFYLNGVLLETSHTDVPPPKTYYFLFVTLRDAGSRVTLVTKNNQLPALISEEK
jgi:hypothetical protein